MILKVVIVLTIILLIAILVFLYLYFTNQLGGFSPWSSKDANPSQEDIQRWYIPNFNPEGWQMWNTEVSNKYFDTGPIYDQNLMLTPWGKSGWGFQIYSWGADNAVYNGPVDIARLHSIDGKFYVFVKNSTAKYFGNGTIIQGWAWGDPKEAEWHCPEFLPTANKKIVASLDINIEQAEAWGRAKWVMIGLTFWFQSPELSKPLVIDLALYLSRDLMFSRESELAYHYQKVVVLDKKEAIGNWRHYDIDVSWFIKDVLKRFKLEYAEDSLTLQSMEMLTEIRQGQTGFWVKNLALYYK